MVGIVSCVGGMEVVKDGGVQEEVLFLMLAPCGQGPRRCQNESLLEKLHDEFEAAKSSLYKCERGKLSLKLELPRAISRQTPLHDTPPHSRLTITSSADDESSTTNTNSIPNTPTKISLLPPL